MNKFKWAIILGLAFGASAALAAEMAVVVTSITYADGELRPITQTTDGALRVSCS